jgi:hypothetical protein
MDLDSVWAKQREMSPPVEIEDRRPGPFLMTIVETWVDSEFCCMRCSICFLRLAISWRNDGIGPYQGLTLVNTGIPTIISSLYLCLSIWSNCVYRDNGIQDLVRGGGLRWRSQTTSMYPGPSALIRGGTLKGVTLSPTITLISLCWQHLVF